MKSDDTRYAEILASLQAGHSYHAMCKTYHVTNVTISDIAREHGIVRKRGCRPPMRTAQHTTGGLIEKQGGKCGLCNCPLGEFIGCHFVPGPRTTEALFAACQECFELMGRLKWNPLIIENLYAWWNSSKTMQELPAYWGGAYRPTADGESYPVMYLVSDGKPFVELPGGKKLYIQNRDKITSPT